MWSSIINQKTENGFEIVQKAFSHSIILKFQNSNCTQCGMCELLCPKEAIKVKTEFPIEFNESYFKEYDLIIKITPILLVIECKKTSSPKSQEPESYNWIKKSKEIYRRTKRKIQQTSGILI